MMSVRIFISSCCLILISSCMEKPKPKSEQAIDTTSQVVQSATPATSAVDQEFPENRVDKLDKGVLAIMQDRKNHYWFGTNEGAFRYDGKSLIVFTEKDGLRQNQVRQIQEDASGRIWFSTGGYGVSYFDGKKIYSASDNYTSGSGKDWTIGKGDSWFPAGGGAYRYHDQSMNYLPFPEVTANASTSRQAPTQLSAYGVYSLLKDRNGNWWFGTQARGVCRFDGKSFTWFTGSGLKGPAVLALFESRDGTLWFGNNGRGLFRYDGKDLTNVTEEKGLANPEFIRNGRVLPGTLARVLSLNEDNAGNLWIGTADAGVWRYDGESLINYTPADGLPDCAIETIYLDKQGQLWFGTNGDGVYKFNDRRFSKALFN